MNWKERVLPISFALYCLFIIIWAYISPLYNDELSALSRINYRSFPLFLEKGILADAHPPLMQLLIALFDKLGFTPALMKSVFSLFGLGSLYFMFRIGRELHLPKENAIIAPILLAGSQIFLTYAVQIRPYQIGMFFVLLQSLALIKLSIGSENPKKWQRWMIFAIVLACYNHYISGLVVGIQFFLAFLYFPKEHRVLLFRSMFKIGILLGPLFPFFVIQSRHRGLAWLGEPNWDFLLDFFSYFTGYHWLGIALVLLLIGLAIWRFKGKFHKESIAMLLTFLASYLVLHIYSISVSPILQFSGLYFALPLLLIALCRNCLGSIQNYGLAAMVFLISFGLTAVNRQHFKIYQLQPHAKAAKWIEQKNDQNLLVFSGLNPEFIKIESKSSKSVNEKFFDFYTKPGGLNSFSRIIETSPATEILLLNPQLWMQDHLASIGFDLAESRFWLNADGLLFKKGTSELKQEELTWIDGEFNGTQEVKLSDVAKLRSDEITVSSIVDSSEAAVSIAISIEKDGEVVKFWSSGQQHQGRREKLVLSARLLSCIPPGAKFEDYSLKYYLHKPSAKAKFKAKIPLLLETKAGNPFRYALFQRLENP